MLKFLIGLETSGDRSFKTKTKTAKLRSRAVSTLETKTAVSKTTSLELSRFIRLGGLYFKFWEHILCSPEDFVVSSGVV